MLAIGSIMPPALVDYSAIAQGVRDWGWASGHSTMEKARQAAIRNCRGNGGGSCSVSTAEKQANSF
ncbi:DUF4189 domain-containing protein [Synechocystis sp. PCC 7338]|uniref:DUF4189 domain-containing protein n=1 Tax=Synechocystis sp. PCC 7338 TaxID=2732530 RepID=UPI002013A814|nr:DUF4189 domain-containing protein [Synechocystis sp. PCC 7338]